MSVPRPPKPARPVANFFFTDKHALEEALERMDERLGERCFTSEAWPFTASDYYEKEMGSGVMRIFAAWRKLVEPAQLVEVKQFSWELEKESAREGHRMVNIDPGLITEGNMVLATGKEAAHRPYLGRGVYVDLTLIYENGTYRPLAWTYPDYAGDEVISLMNRLRKDYLKDRRETEK